MAVEPVTLDEAKKHLRVEFNDDDALIEGLIVAARQWAEDFLNRSLVAAPPTPAEPNPKAPEVLQKWKQAMLLVLGHWYANREDAMVGTLAPIPLGATMLLWQNRNIPL